MRKAIPLLFILLICCTTASASFMNLQVYPRDTSIDAYPGQEISLDFEYSTLYSSAGDQKQIKLYSTTESGEILLPTIYREYFSMEGIESISKSVPYTISQDKEIGDKIYLQLIVYTKMPVGDGYQADNSVDGYSIEINVVEQAVADDSNIDVGIINDFANGSFINNFLIGILGLLIFGISLRFGFPQMILSNPLYLILSALATVIFFLAVII